MSGILYGVGVGPGDPELLTIKALRLIRENTVLAFPGENCQESVAYQIVKGAYEQVDEKHLVAVPMPMTKDKRKLEEAHEEDARMIAGYLEKGENVVFLTLGDPTVYSTYMYVHHRVLAMGYQAEVVSGITSFCAVAARLNMSLVEMAEALHVIPATFQAEDMDEILKHPGTKVLMKSGKKLKEIRESILRSGQDAVMIENCGMPEEKIYRSAQEIPEQAGYYTLIIVKERISK